MVAERYKFLLPLSIVLLITFVSLGAINYSISEQHARKEVVNNTLPLFRDAIFTSITQLLQKPILISSAMSNDAFIKAWAKGGEENPQQMVNYLSGIREAYGFESAFFVSAKSDVYYHYTGVHRALDKERPEDHWYFSFLASKKKVSLDINTDDVFSGELMLFTDFRIEDEEGKLLGITGVAVKFSNVSDLLRQQQQSLAQRVYLVNEKGIIQVHTDTSLVEKHSMEDMPGRREVAKDILAGRKETRSYTIDSGPGGIIASVRYIPEIHWYLIVEQDEESFMFSVRQNMERTAIIGLFATIIVMSIAMMMANRHQKRVSELAITDTLTGLVNRRGFLDLFQKAISRASRSEQSYSLAVVDLDFFKEINDQHGHHIGDVALKKLSERVTGVLRGGDVFARWGGDEFLLLMEASPTEASIVLDRVRKAVESKPVAEVDGNPLFISLSCGATCLKAGDSIESANKRADGALYLAKRDGRACTRLDTTFTV